MPSHGAVRILCFTDKVIYVFSDLLALLESDHFQLAEIDFMI